MAPHPHAGRRWVSDGEVSSTGVPPSTLSTTKFSTSSRARADDPPALLLRTCVNCCAVPRAPFTGRGMRVNQLPFLSPDGSLLGAQRRGLGGLGRRTRAVLRLLPNLLQLSQCPRPVPTIRKGFSSAAVVVFPPKVSCREGRSRLLQDIWVCRSGEGDQNALCHSVPALLPRTPSSPAQAPRRGWGRHGGGVLFTSSPSPALRRAEALRGAAGLHAKSCCSTPRVQALLRAWQCQGRAAGKTLCKRHRQ